MFQHHPDPDTSGNSAASSLGSKLVHTHDGLALPSLSPLYLSRSEHLFRCLARTNSELSQLANALKAVPLEQRAILLNRPLSKSKLLPLLIAARGAQTHRLGALGPQDIIALPRLMIHEGADPLARDGRGRVPLLADSLATDPEILSHLLEGTWANVPLRLTRDEKMWLYCRTQIAFRGTSYGALPQALCAKLFRGDVDLQGQPSYRSLRHLLRDRGRHGPIITDEKKRESLIIGIASLVESGILLRHDAARLLNFSFDRNDELVAHAIARSRSSAARIVPILQSLGVSFGIPCGNRSKACGNTPIHIAAHADNLTPFTTPGILEPWHLLQQNVRGDTPLHVYLKEHIAPKSEAVFRLCEEPSVLLISNSAGDRPCDLALRCNNLDLIHLIRTLGGTPSLKQESQQKMQFIDRYAAFFRNGLPGSQHTALFAFSELNGHDRALFVDAMEALVTSGFLPTSSVKSARARLSPHAPETTLSRLMPQLMRTKTPSTISWVATIIDTKPFTWGVRSAPRFHPNEAELLAMLAFPGLIRQGGAALHKVIFGLTSTRRFDLKGVRSVSDEVVRLWADIGSLGFEFLNLKYDARTFIDTEGKKQTLLGAYGFVRRERKPPWYLKRLPARLAHYFGARSPAYSTSWHLSGDKATEALRIQRFKDQRGILHKKQSVDRLTNFAMYRTHMSISHPEHGELIVRNSAPDGGRDTLLHPAYIVDPQKRSHILKVLGVTTGNQEWTFEQIEHNFFNVLDVNLYPKGELGREMRHAQFLLEQYRTLIHDYRSWGFDLSPTSAYIDDPLTGERFLTGAYKSPGYRIYLQALRYWLQSGESLELAFCEKNFPAWGEYSSIPITEDTLEELERLSHRDFSSPGLYTTGVFDFVQTGLNSFGDLIIRKVADRRS